MNLHVPQSHGGMFELQTFMSVTNHIVSAQHNSAIIGIVQDGLLGSFLMTSEETKISKTLFYDMMMNLKGDIDLKKFMNRIYKYYPNDLKKIKNSLSFQDEIPGRVVYSILFPEDFSYTTVSDNGTIIIKDGIIMPDSCPICKKAIGTKMNSIAQILTKSYGNQTAADFLSNVQFLVNRWLPSRGFSVGIRDCMIENFDEIEKTLQKAYAECQEKIEIGNETLEKELNSILNSTTNVGMKITKEGMKDGKDNRFVVMYKSGAKGSHINCSQITAFVGQQNVRGQRIPKNISGGTRCLPFFEPNDNTPAARGFVNRSYMAGLTPQQMYFAAMGGREGLIDTAIKTAQTGYSQRKIVKKQEDLKAHFDGSVRTSDSKIVQFIYGRDGMDASKLYNVDGKALFIDPVRVAEQLNYGAQEKLLRLSDKLIDNICKKIRINKVKCDNVEKASELIRIQLRKRLLLVRIAASKVKEFVKIIDSTFQRSVVEGGEMVGIVSSCSIGEPTTQGTLNTFHFSGISEKDVTLGVPRLQECLDATKKPKTPSCMVFLKGMGEYKNDRQKGLEYAQSLKSEYQYSDVSYFLLSSPKISYIESDKPALPPIDIYKYEIYKKEWWVDAYKKLNPGKIDENDWVIELDFDVEKLYQFKIELREIGEMIEKNDSVGKCYCIVSPNSIGKIHVYIDYQKVTAPVIPKLEIETENEIQLITEENLNFYYTRDVILKSIMDTKICGIEQISRVFTKEVNGEWVIDTQGCNFIDVLNSEHTLFEKTVCDDFWQIYRTLGVEAAREVLLVEFNKSICSDGSYINPRHIELLVDSMIFTGTITSVRREGIDRSVGPLAKCAFEKTVENFAIASMFCEQEDVSSVSASITLGKIMGGGTGFSEIIKNPPVEVEDDVEEEISEFEKYEKELEDAY